MEKNNDFIWAALNRISESAMLRALKEQQDLETRGWLELNLIARRSNMLPVKMEPWIDQWYQRTPSTCSRKASESTSTRPASR
jgi:outer membrane PBP1 activator LpoA protein